MHITQNNRVVVSEVPASPSPDQRFHFTEDVDIMNRGIKFNGVESLNAAILTATQNGKTVVSAASLLKARVTLVDVRGNEKMQNYPLTGLLKSVNAGFLQQIGEWEISLTKSFVQFANVSGLTAGEVVPLVLYWS